MSSGRDSRRGSKADVLQPGSTGAATSDRDSKRSSKADTIQLSSTGRNSRRGSKADTLQSDSSPSSPRASRRASRVDLLAASSESVQRSAERKEKAKSSQSYTQYSSTRRSSLKPEEGTGSGGAAQRPRLGSRTNSLPLADNKRGNDYNFGVRELDDNLLKADGEMDEQAAQAAPGAGHAGQDEDEVAGVTGTVRQYQPFRSPELEEPLPEINIAIIGGDGVGKSTYLQGAMDMPYPPSSKAAERTIPYDGTAYLIRILEISIDDVDIDDDDTVSWPATVADKMMPRVDGVLTLYDVQNRSSLEGVPETLAAVYKAGLPSVLVSAKCDTPFPERQVDPVGIEMKARQSVKNLLTLQASVATPETYKRGIALIVKAFVHGIAEGQGRSLSDTRRRAQSTAIRPVSPRPPSLLGHARASSEYSAIIHKDKIHSRHDSSLAGYGASDRLKVPLEQQDSMVGSFLLEESGTESVSGSARSSESIEVVAPPLLVTQNFDPLPERGATFEELVDRLLAQPTSKSDGKFVVIFLALYRKFTAPGRLLEAIVERFDRLERNGTATMIKLVAQLRCLSVLEQWISHYPGDFAYVKTRRRMRTFIAKISAISIFYVAAKEMSAGLETVQEDDDTNWAYSDKNRDTSDSNVYRWTMSSSATTLIDDDSFIYPDNMSTMTTNGNESVAASTGAETAGSFASTASSQLILNAEAAQRQAQLLQPKNRVSLTKMEWRAVIEFSEDLFAKELTRMDWIMFSSIRPRDLVRHVSLKTSEKASCKNLVNVNRMIDHFNHIAAWVSNFILFRDKPKHRAIMLEKLMRIARKLRELNNYNALGAFIAGINSTAIHRLAATRELIPPAVGKDWMKLEILMSQSRSYSAYRLAWENSSSERIPYIPLHRRDLVSAEEGNKTFIGEEKDARINWKKFEVMGEVIVGLQRAQGLPYRGLETGRGGEQIRDLVLDIKITRDEDELYARSTNCEASATQGGTASGRFREFFKR